MRNTHVKNASMKKYLAVALGIILTISCDSNIAEKVSELESRVSAIEEQIAAINGDIAALQALAQKMSEGKMVKEEKKTDSGYTLVFTDGSSIDIHNGEAGNAPVIGIKKDDDDGNWYWTLDGDWLKDADGNRIRANGQDGGQGVTPQIHVQDGFWQLSTDDGKTWTNLAPYDDPSANLITGIDAESNPRFIYITLRDGSVLAIPRAVTFSISFEESSITVMAPGEEKTVNFTLEGGSEKNTVKAFGQGGWVAKVNMESSARGSITVIAPDPIVECEVIVIASDGEGYTVVASLDMVSGELHFNSSLIEASVLGGKATLKVLYAHPGYTVATGANWIRPALATTVLHEEELVFNVDYNSGPARSCTIELRQDDSVVDRAVVMQDGFGITNGNVSVFSYDKATTAMSVSSAEGRNWFRFLDRTSLSYLEVGPVPDGLSAGDTFESRVRSSVDGDIVSDTAASFKVLRNDGGAIKLQDTDGNIYVIRI